MGKINNKKNKRLIERILLNEMKRIIREEPDTKFGKFLKELFE